MSVTSSPSSPSVPLTFYHKRKKRRPIFGRKPLEYVKREENVEIDEKHLTKWEENALAHMGWMLREARIFLMELEYFYTRMDGKQEVVVPMVADKASRCLQFLKSLLDYTTYFCHCHFSYKGNPSKANHRKITFPYKESKTSDELKKDVKKIIFGFRNDEKSTPHEINKILEVFLRVQPILSDETGDQIGKCDPDQDETGETSCLNDLLSLTDYTTELGNDFIGFAKKDAYWDVTTDSLKHEQNESQSLLRVKEGFFILIPYFRQCSNETEFFCKPLLKQMLELAKFVAVTAKEILQIACENSKDLIDKEFDEGRVQGCQEKLKVDGYEITWGEYDQASSLLYL